MELLSGIRQTIATMIAIKRITICVYCMCGGSLAMKIIGSTVVLALSLFQHLAIFVVAHLQFRRLVALQLDGVTNIWCNFAAETTLAQQRVYSLDFVPTCKVHTAIRV